MFHLLILFLRLLKPLPCSVLGLLLLSGALQAQTTVITYGDTWKYNVPTADPGTAWRGLAFDDTVPLNGVTWGSGAGLLGFEGAPLPSPGIQAAVGVQGNTITYLFRKTFTFSGDPAGATLVIDQIVDDGVAYYLNGNYLGSTRHTVGGAWNAVATAAVGDAVEEVGAFTGPATGLVNGTNVLTAEVHQSGTGSSDLVFGAQMKINAVGPTLRILPLGDSITAGQGSPGGYRKRLHTLLTTAGYTVDFLGTKTDGTYLGMRDPEHEGHPAWRIDMLDSNLSTWLALSEPPDVILLDIGTNDFGFNQDNLPTTEAINRLDRLITRITTLRPFAHLIVTNLTVRTDAADALIQSQFNPQVPGLVTAHAALGQRVTFLDMRSFLTVADIADEVHPKPAGYDKMADAWLPAIQAVVAPNGDNQPPGIARVVVVDSTHLVVTLSKPVEDAAALPANFTISGLTVSAAALDSAKRQVTLTTSPMTDAQSYTLAVSNVRDRTTPQHTTPAGTTATFTGPPVRGALVNVPEAADYTLVYSLNIPDTADYNLTPPAYTVDNHVGLGAFARVAYYLELQKAGQPLQYCWVSMDAFTTDAAKIGVPCTSTGAVFQQNVSNLKYFSNVVGRSNVSRFSSPPSPLGPPINTNIEGLQGSLEFWPTDYGTEDQSYFLFFASGTAFDSADTRSATGSWGSMQVHVPGAAGTLFAYNHWGNAAGGISDLGIGNQPVPPHKDWTKTYNANTYTVKTLQVFVRLTRENPLSGRVERQGAAAIISFTGLPNGNYRIQRTTDLVTWTNLADVPSAASGDIAYTDSAPPAGKVFYQVQRLP